MDVEHRLSRLRVAVEHGPKTGAVVSLLPGDLRGGPDHCADEAVVALAEVVQRRNVLLRHDQHVQRRLRVDVGKGQQPIVFVDFRRRNLTSDDSTKQTGHRNNE